MFKEIFTLSSQWTPTILISQTELHHHLPCSIVVLLIGSEIGLKKVWFKLLKNSPLSSTLLWNRSKLKSSKMKPGIKFSFIPLSESTPQSSNWIKDWPKVLKSLITSPQEISLTSSNILLNFIMKRSLFFKINSSIWMSAWISWNLLNLKFLKCKEVLISKEKNFKKKKNKPARKWHWSFSKRQKPKKNNKKVPSSK